MAITTSTYADRSGELYGGKVAPDELIPVAATTSLAEDTVVAAAVKWLAQSAKNNCDQSIRKNTDNK